MARGHGTMGDMKCPSCGNNSFQVQSRTAPQRVVTFICVACWKEWRLEDMTREFVKHQRERPED